MELVAGNRTAIEAHLRHLGWIGENETITELAPAGEGNMNRTLRARLPARSLILKQALPYVAKYPQIPAPVQRQEAEAAFYQAIAGTANLSRHTPAVLGADPEHHLLCLEDLGDTGDLTCLYAEGPTSGHASRLTALCRWLAELHALLLEPGAMPDNADMRTLNHAHIFEVPFDRDSGVDLSAGLAARRLELGADEELQHRVRELGEIYLGARRHASAPALLHGDYYPGSWLAHPERTVAVIDPEFAFVGPPELDVGVLMAHLIMAGLGDDDIAEALVHYHPPRDFSHDLADAFAGIEVIRRLLGVAQLPLAADEAARLAWLDRAGRALGQ